MTQTPNGNSAADPSSQNVWRPVVRAGLRAERVGAELVLLDRAKKKVHQLDAVGTQILELCDGKRSEFQIAHCLTTRYDTEQERLRRDVEDFLRQLAAAGVIA